MSPFIEEHYYGGAKAFYNKLLEKGLLNPTCQRCGIGKVTLFFGSKEKSPRTYCKKCKAEVPSCRNGTIFDLYDIRHIPAFMFMMKCVVRRVAVESAIDLCGLDPETGRRYIEIVRTVMTHTADVLYQDWEGKLGGPGVVVEVDEAFMTESKYHVGRQLAKNDVIILGMTEREGGPTRVEDVRLLQYIFEKEQSRSDEETVQHAEAFDNALVLNRQTDPIDDRVFDETTTQVVLSDDESDDEEEPDDDEPQQPEPQTAEPVPAGQQQTRPRFKMIPAFESAEKQLFGPKERNFPKRTVMFVVPNRRAETLIPLIRKYVKPGTFVFTDKWLAYWDLRNGYKHFVVVHKKRFVQYHFFPNQVVLKVTTNHIERIWVEMRKDLRGVKKEDIERRLREVPYRLFRLWSAKLEDRDEALMADIRAYVTDKILADSGSVFRLSRPMEE